MGRGPLRGGALSLLGGAVSRLRRRPATVRPREKRGLDRKYPQVLVFAKMLSSTLLWALVPMKSA